MEFDVNFYKRVLDSLYDGVYMVDKDRRILYWNKGAERITGFKSEEVLGRFCRDNVLVHVDEMGESLCSSELCPAHKTIVDGSSQEKAVYLQHKTGHRLPVLNRISPIWNPQREVVGAVEVFSDNRELHQAEERVAELQRLALLDSLTGIGNRRFAEIHLQRGLSEMDRYGWAFTVFFMDVDRFKGINDTYGHDAGDEVLRMVAKTLTGALRSSDAVARWGGEEFVAIVANAENMEPALIGNKMRALVEHSSMETAAAIIRVTVSIGATQAKPDDTVESIIARADKLMYESKQGGRNRVTTDR